MSSLRGTGRQTHEGRQTYRHGLVYVNCFQSHKTLNTKNDGVGAAEDRSILGVLRPVNREGSYQGETKCIYVTGKIMIHYLKWRRWGKGRSGGGHIRQ